MLNKRFKIAKCKTSLKLATSRIKLMKNKKGIQINQMKRELAQLLESGQDRTARIRVEHVIREEKMVAAYDLIEIYCELIVARLPIIESQKTCPIDLKEAITSVIFAAPRCSDIPELIDARKNFTAKYGKEFVSAALELRPDSGVSRMIVEKLSAVAPDVQTKVKVLSGIAKEHNVNWEPTLFEETESKPLNGPVNFEQESMMKVNPPEIQIPNVQNVQSHEEKLNVPDDFSQQNRRYTLGTHNISSNDMRPSGTDSEMFNKRHSFHSNSNKSSSNRENNWNMEFKDATSAAQAAAESAERASRAARAAAQLSSQGKITRQYSTESHHSKDSYNSSFNNRNPKVQNPQTDPNEDNTSPKATNEVIRTRKPQVSTTPEVPSQHRNPKLQNPQTDPNTSQKATKPVIRKQPSYKDDETDSDDDDHKSDTRFDYNEGQAKSFFPSPGRESESTHISSPRKNRIELNDLVERGSHVYDDEDSKLQFRYESKKNDIEPEILENNSELKFGTLTGGLRNKGGVKYPPYTKNTSSPSSKKLVEDKESQIKVNQKSEPTSFSRSEKKKPSVSMSSSESDSDDQNDKFVKKNRSRFAPPGVFFNDDFEEEVSPVFKPTSAGRAGLSRRTKDNVEVEGKTVISSKHDSTNGSSSPKISEQPQNTRKTEETKTSDLGSKTSIDVNKLKKPSHVHPKLPDYDSLAARMQSLRANHK